MPVDTQELLRSFILDGRFTAPELIETVKAPDAISAGELTKALKAMEGELVHHVGDNPYLAFARSIPAGEIANYRPGLGSNLGLGEQ